MTIIGKWVNIGNCQLIKLFEANSNLIKNNSHKRVVKSIVSFTSNIAVKSQIIEWNFELIPLQFKYIPFTLPQKYLYFPYIIKNNI